MTEAFVVDASVAFAWVYPAQASADTDKLLDDVESGVTVVVPSLWFVEVANGLLAAERRKLLTAAERAAALKALSNLSVTMDEETGHAAFHKTSELADTHGLSVYDAVYLEAALRRNLPLASRDKALRDAAKRCGLKLRLGAA